MPAGHVSARSTLEALVAPFARSQQRPLSKARGAPGVWLRARERKQRVGREKGEERARVDGDDGGGVLIDGSLI